MEKIRFEWGKSTRNDDIFNYWWKNTEKSDYKLHSAGNRWINQRIKDIVDAHLKKQQIHSVVDIGSGDGSRLFFLSKLLPECKIIGYDSACDAISIANQKYAGGNLTFIEADANKIRISADMVTSFGVLEHINEWKIAVSGWLEDPSIQYFLCYFPTGRLRKNEYLVGHVNAFRRHEVEDYLKSLGFEAIECTYGGFPFYSPLFRTIQYASIDAYAVYNAKRIEGFNRILHESIYVCFKYLSCQKIKGDEFVGLFERKKR